MSNDTELVEIDTGERHGQLPVHITVVGNEWYRPEDTYRVPVEYVDKWAHARRKWHEAQLEIHDFIRHHVSVAQEGRIQTSVDEMRKADHEGWTDD